MPRISFSASAIAKLARSKTPGEYTDQRYPNLVLRVLPSGRLSWLVRLPREPDPKRPGKMRRPGLTLGSYPALSLAVAVRRYHEELSKHTEGADVASRIRRLERELAELRRQQGREVTVRKMVEDFLASHEERLSAATAGNYERAARLYLVPLLGDRSAGFLEAREIDEALQQVSPGRVAGVLTVLRMAYRRAIMMGLVQSNPCLSLESPVQRSRDRHLEVQEIVHVWREIMTRGIHASTRDALQLLLFTAQRLDEVCSLPWSEIRGGLWTLPAERTKPRRPNYIPLLPLARNLLASRREIHGGWCFGSKITAGSVSKAGVSKTMTFISRKLCSEGLLKSPVRTHDLRRTAATWMGNLGADQTSIKAVLNHRDSSVTAVYDRARYIERAHDALGRWDLFLQVLRRYL